MNTVFRYLATISLIFTIVSCNTRGGNENTIVLIKTSSGDIKVKLYDETPIHRDNFIKLVQMGFYEGISFHRVINDFMIQAGDPKTRTGLTREQLDTLDSYTIPAEFRGQYFHKNGALAAASMGNDVNPEMRSSGTQFYIVQGKRYTPEELKTTVDRVNSNLRQIVFSKFIRETTDSARLAPTPLSESEIQEIASMKMFNYLTSVGEYTLTPEQTDAYINIGGVPRLDMTYTVFGEVVEGLEIVDRIAGSPTDQSDKPINDIRIISMKLTK